MARSLLSKTVFRLCCWFERGQAQIYQYELRSWMNFCLRLSASSFDISWCSPMMTCAFAILAKKRRGLLCALDSSREPTRVSKCPTKGIVRETVTKNWWIFVSCDTWINATRAAADRLIDNDLRKVIYFTLLAGKSAPTVSVLLDSASQQLKQTRFVRAIQSWR